MAKKKKSKSGGGKRRSSHRKTSHHRKGTRRRRNPGNDFMSRAGRVLGVGLVALGTGALVLVGQSRFEPGTALSQYGIPVAGAVVGVALAKKMPTLGIGMAIGSVAAPFTLPLASKVNSMLPAPAATATTSGLAAVQLRGALAQRLGPSRRFMGAVNMGAVHT
jgi:hypothetical protein